MTRASITLLLLLLPVQALAVERGVDEAEQAKIEAFWAPVVAAPEHTYSLELGWGGYNWDVIGAGVATSSALRLSAGARFLGWFGAYGTVDYTSLATSAEPLTVDESRWFLTGSAGLERWIGALRLQALAEFGATKHDVELRDESGGLYTASSTGPVFGASGNVAVSLYQHFLIGLDVGIRAHNRKLDSLVLIEVGWLL